jgi:hypothetical protein
MKRLVICCLFAAMLIAGCGGEDALEGSGILTGTWAGILHFKSGNYDDRVRTMVLIHTGSDVEGTMGSAGRWLDGTYDPTTRTLTVDWGQDLETMKLTGTYRFRLETDNDTLVMTAIESIPNSGSAWWDVGEDMVATYTATRQ